MVERDAGEEDEDGGEEDEEDDEEEEEAEEGEGAGEDEEEEIDDDDDEDGSSSSRFSDAAYREAYDGFLGGPPEFVEGRGAFLLLASKSIRAGEVVTDSCVFFLLCFLWFFQLYC